MNKKRSGRNYQIAVQRKKKKLLQINEAKETFVTSSDSSYMY